MNENGVPQFVSLIISAVLLGVFIFAAVIVGVLLVKSF
jgi:hypothetical protein